MTNPDSPGWPASGGAEGIRYSIGCADGCAGAAFGVRAGVVPPGVAHSESKPEKYSADVERERGQASCEYVSMWGGTMRSGQNIPLAVMSVVSAAILLAFALSSAMRSPRQQQIGCGSSENTAIAPAWPRAGLNPRGFWNPAFPPSPPSRRVSPVGCPKSKHDRHWMMAGAN
jgi:hypothetical protein